MGRGETVASKADLLEVILALGASSRLAHLLHGRDQESDQHRDDGDDDEKLDEGKTGPDGAHRPPST